MRPAAPRRQSLLREQARCALLPAATPPLNLSPMRGGLPVGRRGYRPRYELSRPDQGWTPSRARQLATGLRSQSHPSACRGRTPQRHTGSPPRMGDKLSGGSPREGVRSELARGATTGGGGPQAPPTRNGCSTNAISPKRNSCVGLKRNACFADPLANHS
jgi:hypothetical protein